MANQKHTTQVLYSGLGGHGNVAFSLVENESNQLNNAFLFYGIEPVKSEYINKCNQLNIPFDSILKQPGVDFKSFKKAYTILKSLQSDVVLLHSITLIIPAVIFGFLNNKRIIAIEHNANDAKRKSEWLWSLLAMLFAYKVVYLTASYKSEVKEKLGVFFSNKKAVVIPNGLNTDLYAPTTKVTSDIIKLGMVSRMNVLRDHKTLVLSIKHLMQLLPNQKIKLYIAGNGDTYDETVALVKKEGLEEVITFTGMLNEDEILSLFKSLDIYVHATLAETMSTSLMQALSCGLPIVSANIPGVRNLIEPDKTGILIETKDEILLAKTLKNLIEDKSKQKELSSSARAFALNNLSNKVMFERYLKIIE